MHHCSLSMMSLHMVEMLVMVLHVSLLNVIHYPSMYPVIIHVSSHQFSMLCHPILFSNVQVENPCHTAVSQLLFEDDTRTVINPWSAPPPLDGQMIPIELYSSSYSNNVHPKTTILVLVLTQIFSSIHMLPLEYLKLYHLQLIYWTMTTIFLTWANKGRAPS